MKSNAVIFASSVICLWNGAAWAQPCVEPIQLDQSIAMPAEPGASVTFTAPLAPGGATVTGTLTNQLNGQTVQIDLVFDYRIDSFLAFDELIECIASDIEFSAPALIQTNLINLNPNSGVSLAYRLTMHHSTPGSYTVRLRVTGNYE